MTDAPAPAPKTDDEALAAVKAEAVGQRLDDGSVRVPLVTDAGTVDILVANPPMWYEGALDALRANRISEWVSLAVEDPDSLAAWAATRKRYKDLEAFVTAWAKATGESPGESQASSTS